MTASGSEEGGGRAGRWLREHGVLLILAVLFVARLPFLSSFMTHVDGIGPILNLLVTEPEGLLGQLASVRYWTFAPAMFLPQAGLLRLAGDHEALLFWGRLPSLVMWFVGLLAAHRLFRATFPERPWVADLLVAIQAVSWRGLIESSQAYNYATTGFVAAAALASFLREARQIQGPPRGLRTLRRLELWTLFAAGLLLGGLAWLTYQALFLMAGGFLGLGLLVVLRRRWGALPRLVVLGLCCAVPVGLVYQWHLKDVAGMGIAPWIPRPVSPDGPLDAPWFLARSWFDVVQNGVTFLPWGAGSAALAALALAGIAAVARRPGVEAELERADADRAILAVLIGLAIVFSAGPLVGAFPLGSTRHSHVLQVPILLALGLGLNRVRLPRRVTIALTACVLLVGVTSGAWLISRSSRRIDLEWIERAAVTDPDLRLVNFDRSWTWDAFLLLRAHPEWTPRIFFIFEDQATPIPGDPARLLVVSHRAALTSAELDNLRQRGYGAPEVVQAVAPTAYTELSGDINGGNGAYVTLLHRLP